MTQRAESVIHGRDHDVLDTLFANHGACVKSVLDATANTRRMWSGMSTRGLSVTFMDIDASVYPSLVGDFTNMPFRNAVFDAVVFDPPHLPAAAGSSASHAQMKRDYGLSGSLRADNVSAFFAPFLREALRVLRQDGLVFAKIKDYVHNHRYQWSLCDFVSAVRSIEGFTPCDLVVKVDPCGGNLASSKWERVHHVRNAHCYWVVVRKGRCEASGRLAPREVKRGLL